VSGLPVVLAESRAFGVPVWRYAVSRREKIRLYGPRCLGEEVPEDERSGYTSFLTEEAWVAAWAGKWGRVSLGRWGEADYALYLAQSEEHFSSICRFADQQGGVIEIAVPSELKWEDFTAFSPIWDTMRPLRYLCEIDLCRNLQVPWVYLLGTYHYAPWVSIFIGESLEISEALSNLCGKVEECSAIAVEDALRTEQQNWEEIYRQFEEHSATTPQPEAAPREFE